MIRIGAIDAELSPSWPTALAMAAELGIQEIELYTYEDRCIENVSLESARKIRWELQERQMKVCNLASTVFLRCHMDSQREDLVPRFAYRSIAGSYGDHLQALDRALSLAQVFQAPAVRIFGFWKEPGELIGGACARAAELLAKPVQMAQEAGIPLALENCPHTWFDWGARAVELVEMVNSPWLRILWDPCAAMRNREPDIFSAYPRICSRLAHVHAKDLRFEPGSKRGHRYVPIGQGQVDWAGILYRLAASCYHGVVSIETHHQGEDGRRETAARATFQGLASLLAACEERRNAPAPVTREINKESYD